MARLESAVRAITDVSVAALSAPDPEQAMRAVGDELVRVLDVDALCLVAGQYPGTTDLLMVSPREAESRLPPLGIPSCPTELLIRMHPGVLRFLQSPKDRVYCTVPDFVTESEWRRSEYARAARPIWGRNLLVQIPVLGWAGGFMQWAGSRDGRYTARDREVAEAVRPIVHAVARNMAALPGHGLHPESTSTDLTQREQAVLNLLAQGLTAQSAAHRLGISPRTVHKHVEHIYRKLDVRDRVQAALTARDLGIIDLRDRSCPRAPETSAVP